VLKGRLSSQAPEIDGSVYLSECDPASVRSGDFLDVDIIDARGYDLVARPASLAVSSAGARPWRP
jgi:hypothetical protein